MIKRNAVACVTLRTDLNQSSHSFKQECLLYYQKFDWMQDWASVIDKKVGAPIY